MSNFFNNLIEKLYLSQKGNLVYWDAMTNVNTRCYYDRVIKPKYDKEEVFIAFLDIDNLKVINDKDGHHAGSDMIRNTAKNLLLLNLLEVCRTGGDEFIIIGDKNFDPSNLNFIEGVSYGYVIKEKDQTISEAVKMADEYMYRRKKRVHKKDARKAEKTELVLSREDVTNTKPKRRRRRKSGRKHIEENNDKSV